MGLSGYFLYQSPNLIHEVQESHKNSEKQKKIKRVIAELKQEKQNEVKPSMDNKITTLEIKKADELSKQEQGKDELIKQEQSKDELIKQEQGKKEHDKQNRIVLYFCESTNTHVKLVPIYMTLESGENKIPQIINKLIHRPIQLNDHYQS